MQRYAIENTTAQLCSLIGFDYGQVAATFGLPEDLTQGVTSSEYFAIWGAMAKLFGRDSLALWLAGQIKEPSWNSETAAFVLSPTVRIGIERLALFKPLICPVRVGVEEARNSLSLSFHSDASRHHLPPDFQAMHPIFVLSLIRYCSGVDVVPLHVGFDGPELDMPQTATFFGCTPTREPFPRLVISAADADLPILSSNADKWSWLEPGLKRRLKAFRSGQTASERVQGTLVEMLPAGLSGIEDVSTRLQTSKRSLQRQLAEEGTRFQNLLADTRKTLALGYLKMPELTIEEVAHLLGYREPNSFYRAFQSWTGKTPAQARG